MTIVLCFCLLVLARIQFLVGMIFGLPYVASGSREWGLRYYQVVAEPFPVSFPVLWIWLSGAMVLWALVTVVWVSRGKRGRWRMRFLVVICAAIVLGYAGVIANAEDQHVYNAQSRMWVYRKWNKEMVDLDGRAAYQLVAHHDNRERSKSLLKVLAASGGVYDRTVGEATEVMRAECVAHQEEVMKLLHKHVDFDAKEVGVIPWKEAVWDEKEELWLFRVYYGETGYVEARLPNWSQECALIVVNTSDLVPWEEPLRWRR